MDNTLILNEIKKFYKKDTNVEFASFLGIAPTTLSSWYSRGSINWDLIFAKCVEINFDKLIKECIAEESEKAYKLNSDSEISFVREPSFTYGKRCELCAAKDELINSLRQNIDIQNKYIRLLEQDNTTK